MKRLIAMRSLEEHRFLNSVGNFMLKRKKSLQFLALISLYFSCFNLWANVDKSTKENLVQAAIRASSFAYAPYSKYYVGAALLTKDGGIISASNVENASYGLTSCAERNAIFKAVTDGKKDFTAIAIVTKDGGFSCGACRQVLNEFSPNILMIVANEQGEILGEVQLNELLIHAFGPSNLK